MTHTKRILYFNSIKVRLKHDSGWKDTWSFAAFQFHKGTIKTYIVCCYNAISNISIP